MGSGGGFNYVCTSLRTLQASTWPWLLLFGDITSESPTLSANSVWFDLSSRKKEIRPLTSVEGVNRDGDGVTGWRL